MTAQQEVAMLQRQQPAASQNSKNTLNEHFARLEQRLPLLSFDAPGTYAKGVERPGEGQGNSGGGKYRSIDAYGIKHFSYLMRLKRKIELVLSVPPFASNRGKIGVPIVGFTVRRSGELAEAVLLRSSGYSEFDQAVVRAIQRAAPYYPFPEHLPEQEISIQVYVSLS
jgi:TonB family protein